MPKTVLSIIALLVTVFLVALGGSLAGNAIAGGGQQGDADVTTAAGSSGADGRDGADGTEGPAGGQGSAGADGPAGPVGSTGLKGAAGPPGSSGQAGDRGAAGPQGSIGAQGVPGPQGAAGAPGQDGAPGADGSDGADGNVNVRFVEKAAQGFAETPNSLLTFSPLLSADKWFLEIHWTPVSGTGECELARVGTPLQPVTPGVTQIVDLTTHNFLTVRCISTTASGESYFVKDAWMRATRVTS